ncbi:MAG TPA: sigma-70 family RNA polymerase sigma factor [Bradyrhizobium sp.]|jgi:RNA polymerase sigma factor (sigma-70 family)|nr:MAG: sigma-70 family RNA polymerase sigma factor [Bradyrhizobium icense]HXH43413.1 sigma-70 family RNA polymerase sigma factor [Bradyrhizobium sp.]
MRSSRNMGSSPAKTRSVRPSAASDGAVRAAIVGSYERLRNYLQKRFSSPSDAEEVLQAFVLRALERSSDIRDADSVRGWLSKVLATTVADFHRQASKNKTREVPLPAELSDRVAVDQDAELESAICECLYAHLPLLKMEHAEVIRRIDLAGEPRETVAAELGVTVNNLTVRLFRARQALKDRLEDKCVICREDSFLECRCGEGRARRPS